MTPLQLEARLLLDLFLVGAAAVLGGAVCRRLGVPEVIGYLTAGILLGPLTPFGDFVRDVETIRSIAAFAVLFRMFALGLEFDRRRLSGRWRPSLLAGLLEITLAALAGLLLARILGWSPLEGAILGAALGTASTNILSRAMTDHGLATREDGRTAGAVALIEDILSISLLAFLAVYSHTATVEEMLTRLGWVALLAFLSLAVGTLVAPVWL